jgi:hypothetical protein
MTNIPYGECHCGCGQKTRLAPYSWAAKGMKQGEPMQFINGHQLPRVSGKDHPNWKGGRSNASRGYININQPNHPRAKNTNQVHEHILIAEKALGKYLPDKAVIHHYSLTELVICQDQAYHALLHQRTRALRACGHASWRKCNYCKEYDKPENLYIRCKAIFHRACSDQRRREARSKK